MSVGIGRVAKQMLKGRTKTCKFYVGSYTDQTPALMTGANRGIDVDLYQPATWLKTGYFLKEYTTEGWFQRIGALDDGSLIRGIVEGEITYDPAGSVAYGKIREFATGDVIKMECDATHTAIAKGDPISIDALDTATGTSHRHGATVDVATAGEQGFGWSQNALALDTAGFIAVDWVQPEYEYIKGGVDGNIAVNIYPIGFFDAPGKIVGVRHNATSQTTAGAFNVTNAGSDIQSTADYATVVAAAWETPDQNLTVAAGAEILLDVSNAGGSSDVLDFRITVKSLKDRVV